MGKELTLIKYLLRFCCNARYFCIFMLYIRFDFLHVSGEETLMDRSNDVYDHTLTGKVGVQT